jgi:hypothetical protein
MSWSMSFLRKSCAPNRHLPQSSEKKLYPVRCFRATIWFAAARFVELSFQH